MKCLAFSSPKQAVIAQASEMYVMPISSNIEAKMWLKMFFNNSRVKEMTIYEFLKYSILCFHIFIYEDKKENTNI